MNFRALPLAVLITFCSLWAGQARAQDVFISGDAGLALIGPPLVPLDQGAAALTSRIGLGAEFDRFQVEFDVGVVSPFAFGEGVLLVPSLDASFLFRRPGADVRPYVGGGLDLVYVLSNYGGFALPWAHLTAGIDSRINARTSFYGEVRTYGLELQFSAGSKFRF